MPDDSPAAEVAFDDYPNVDFTPRFVPHDNASGIIEYPSLNGHSPKHPLRPHWFLRFYRMLRKLVRQRQESVLNRGVRREYEKTFARVIADAESEKREAKDSVAQARSDAAKEVAALAKRIESRDRALDELRQQMNRAVDQLKETIASREKDIKNHVELEIPKLKRELQVVYTHVEFLEKLLERKLVRVESEIAVQNKYIVDAETASDQLRQSAFMAERGR